MEEATLGRVIGLIACSSLVAAALWLTNLATTTRTLSAGNAPQAEQQALAARDAFKRGKELYLRGRYAEAVPLLLTSSTNASELNPTERQVATEYLSRARQRLGNAQAGVRSQSPDDFSLPRGVEDAAKTRVERLMSQAKGAAQQGRLKDATTLATQAFQISREARLTFAKGEISPGEFLAMLQDGASADIQNMAWAQEAAPTRKNIQQVSGEAPDWETFANSPAAQPADKGLMTDGSNKSKAEALVASARKDITAGEYDAARKKALAALEMKVSYDLFDDRPELVIADIDRKAGTVTAAGVTTKPAAVQPAAEMDESRRQNAAALVAEARNALEAGQMDVARAKAVEAQKMGASYKLFDDRPELVLSDLGTRAPAANKIAQTSASANEMPAASADAKAQVTQLLAEARSALTGGLVEDARRKAMEAEKIASAHKLTFQLFEDRPEIVIADAARMATRGPANAPANVAANDPAVIKSRQQAEALLKQAREALAARQFDKARSLADQADSMNVAYEVFADTPDSVLADVESAYSSFLANNQKVQPAGAQMASGNTASGNTLDAAFGEDPFKVAAANDTAPAAIPAQGLSAIDLYNRGMFELNRGNRDGAYQAFAQAYESGQKLDKFRTQRLRDYLRELAPKGGRDVQMVNHQTDGGPAAVSGGVIDDAAREKSLKFDRLRTETLSTIFKAEQLREKDPEAALQMIDRQLATIESSELAPEAMAQLQSSLGKTRVSLTNEILQQKPNLDQKRHNEEVLAKIKGSTETKIRIEQEYAKLVEEFNELFKQKRFAEAEVVAKKAKELNPSEPTSETLIYKSRLARRVDSNEQLKTAKEQSLWTALDDVERAFIIGVGDATPIEYPKNWQELTDRRKKFGGDNRTRSEAEIKIQGSLNRAVSLHEDNVPLGEVVKKLAAMSDINIVIDPRGLDEETASIDALVSIDVDGIPMKSVLNLVLERFNLAYMIQDDVLKITSRLRQQGQLIATTYPVADLVVPIPNFTMGVGVGANSVDPRTGSLNANGSMMSLPSGMGGMGGQAMAQVGPNVAGGMNPAGGNPRESIRPQSADYDTLVELITRTVAPDSWEQVGGPASIQRFETTLSLVIRQTQAVHAEIVDLLKQLRRLQDLQVTVEVRFVTVSDSFFERIGVDFDFNVQGTAPGAQTDNDGLPLPPFGSIQLPTQGASSGTSGTTGTTGTTGNTQGTQGTQGTAGGTGGLFQQQPTRNLIQRNSYQKGGTIVGLGSQTSFSDDLSIPFRQGSFDIGVPDFGGFDPTAGITTGLAILSDIEAFFFIQAAQGDSRSNLLFAPKLTLFNGQTATVSDTVQRYFVTGYDTTVGVGAAIQTPRVTPMPEGVSLTVTAVISADRRYVRLTIIPNFTSITDVQTFSTASGVTGNQNQGGGQIGQGGGQQFGGNQQGGGQQVGGNNFGFGGIGGFGGNATIANQVSRAGMSQVIQGGVQQNGNNQGGNGQVQQAAQVVQLPVVEQVTVLTTVSVPDGGTVLLGGVKRLREGRNMAGVPILNKIPYVSRLFKNSGVGRETESLMLMVTPRIVIQEEEEELLGVEIN